MFFLQKINQYLAVDKERKKGEKEIKRNRKGGGWVHISNYMVTNQYISE